MAPALVGTHRPQINHLWCYVRTTEWQACSLVLPARVVQVTRRRHRRRIVLVSGGPTSSTWPKVALLAQDNAVYASWWALREEHSEQLTCGCEGHEACIAGSCAREHFFPRCGSKGHSPLRPRAEARDAPVAPLHPLEVVDDLTHRSELE